MNIVEFLKTLSVQGWQLWVEGDRLRYRAPKEATAAVFAKLKAHKSEVISLLRDNPDIVTVYPLSPGQRSLWFIWQLAPDSAAYNLGYAGRVRSEVDIPALEKAFQLLIRRHSVLGNTFPKIGKEPVQHPSEASHFSIQQIDAATWTENELRSRVISAYRQPFDLEQGPIIRCQLFSRSAQDQVLLLVIHHIACDAWSIGVLLDELKTLYPAIRQGLSNPLAPLDYTYRDFVAWQAQLLSGPEGETLGRYWQQQLSGELLALTLPTDFPRPPVQTYNGASYATTLAAPLTQQLKQVAQRSGVTLFMLLLAAFQVLLHRYTGQAEIIVGSPTSGRSRAEFASLIGFFINPVAIRSDLSGEPSFQDCLQQVQTQVLGALEHQNYPFALVTEQLPQQRNASHAPVFQVSFNLQTLKQSKALTALNFNQSTATVDWGGLELKPFLTLQQEGHLDLSLEMVESGSDLVGAFKYNADLFNEATIARLGQHFQTLLNAITHGLETPISQLPVMPPAERKQLLEIWSGANAVPSFDDHSCLPDLFEQQAKQTPDALAVIAGEQTLTYRELNQRADQLAAYLSSLGIGPDKLVGLYLARSLDLIVGIVGIWKAGGAYVPLSPTYPRERISYILNDANVSVLLTHQHLHQQLEAPLDAANTTVIRLDQDWDAIATSPPWVTTDQTPALTLALTPDNLAYVIYTSGTTGQPKGVMVEQRSVVNLLHSLEERIYSDEADTPLRVSLNGPISFDTSVKQIIQLLNGRTLNIIPDTVRLDGQALKTYLKAYPVDVFDCTPSQLELLKIAGWLDQGLLPKRILLGGEAISASMWRSLASIDAIRFFNLYGPTECTVDATVKEIEASDSGPTLGRPLANVSLYVLDAYRQPVPIGVTGELCIGGAGVARGYLRQPELSKAKFIDHPFTAAAGERLYHTGDLARYLPDGTLEFVGRADNQVKIRGFRIELGDIEAALTQHAAIREAVVTVREDEPNIKRLVAYVVTRAHKFSGETLRTFLKERLPEYMVPPIILRLDELPLTPNGKVDRQALPALDQTCRELGTPFVAPQTPTEITLAQIWAEVLGLDQVGSQDNFFELGGDSVLAIQIIARANQDGIKISPRLLFQYPTVAELAAKAQTKPIAIAKQESITGPVPLTPIQLRFFERQGNAPHHYNQSVLLEVSSRLDAQNLQKAIGILLSHHDALRLRFKEQNGQWQVDNAAYEPGMEQVCCQVVALSDVEPEQQMARMQSAIATAQASLNITDGPLLRVCLFRLPAASNDRLLIVLHHLVVDGISWRILLDDLSHIYDQLRQNETVQLPAKTTAFQTWAQRIASFVRTSDQVEQALDFWEAMTEPAEALPNDYPDGIADNTEASAQRVITRLSLEQTRLLLQSVPAAYNTQINDVLLTALMLGVQEWTGQSSLQIDLEGHGREDIFDEIELTRTVGWFTNVFPMRLTLEATNNLGDGLKRIKAQLRHIPQKGIGFGFLKYLHPDFQLRQRLHQRPTSHISFNYLGQFDQVQRATSDWVVGLAPEPSEPNRDPHGQRAYLIDVVGQVLDGKLQLEWIYSDRVHRPETIEKLANGCLQALQTLIDYCLSQPTGALTPADFPLANLIQIELDKLVTTQQPIADIYPLSPVQEGMLFHTLYAPDSAVYFEQFSITLAGELDVNALQQAWQQVINHHPILRTTFLTHREQPLQVVQQVVQTETDAYEHLWTQLDFRDLSEAQQATQLQALLQQDIAQGFAWDQVPMRFSLIQMGRDRARFIWSFHHLLFDGWCLPRLMKQVLACYEAHRQGRRFDLPPTRPYGDYIAWLQQQDPQQARAFWQAHLAQLQSPTPLGIGTSRTLEQVDEQKVEAHHTLPADLTEALKATAQQHRLTLYTLLQGAWALLLSRYSGEPDVLFGTVVSGRTPELAGIEAMIGLFINTLPVRVQVNDETPLLNWLSQLQMQQVEREQYAATALVEIQGWSDIPRDLPLFESLLVFENYPVDDALKSGQPGGLTLTDLQFFEQTNYPLTVIATPAAELSLRSSYDPSRFDAAVIQRLLSHLQQLLSAMVAGINGQIGDLQLLSEAERQQLVVDWNQTERLYTNDTCVHHWVEAQVARSPDAIAVSFDNQALTYRELNAQANQLAHYLQSLGAGPDIPIGLCVQRSLKMAVAVLAILKAGSAYVPLDPSYPAERLRFMVEDVQAPILLTETALTDSLPQQGKMIALDQDWPLIGQQPDTNPDCDIHPENLLYIIYTSGSTGQPKGIPLSHHALGNLIQWHLEALDPGGMLQFASLSFDASFHEMFAAWCAGDTLYLIPEEMRQDVEKLVHFLSTHPVQKAILPVALWQQMAEMYGTQHALFSGLKDIITTGEQLQITRSMIEVAKNLPHCRFHNHYGPSETHVVTAYTFNQTPETWPLYPPIGTPVANTQIYILDAHYCPVPMGVPGFLLIGGANLARGYLNRPALTAEKFIANPFGMGRLYQTGDRARYLPEGQIEFLGRVDDQVKIRGFRIELGEVEAVLNKCGSISQGVIIVHGSSSDRLLVAYVVPNHDQSLDIETVRQFLQQRLPAYMIPSSFIVLEALPLTANRKVNRRALPRPDLTNRFQQDHTPPRNPTEAEIVAAFVDILDLEQVGIHCSFFDLGGHSLLATRVVSRLRATLNIDIPLRLLFEAPTAARFAKAIEEQQEKQQSTSTPMSVTEIEAVSRDQALPLSWAQERLWFLDKLEGGNVTNNMPIAVKITGNLHVAVLEQALSELVERHEILRTRFPTIEGSPVQEIVPPLPVVIAIEDFQSLSASVQQITVQQRFDQEIKQPINLAIGPLMRVQLLRLAQQQNVLIITFHHAIYDAWSGSIFIQELADLYRSGLTKTPPERAPLSVQYADFAIWQRQWLQGEILEKQLGYWQRQLQGPLPILQFPADFPQPPAQDYRGLQTALQLDTKLTNQLKALSQREGVTLFMTLLTAFKVLLARHTGQEDIIVGTPIAGRNHLGTEQLIGFFVNTLPLRTDLIGNPTFQALLARVREVTLGAYGHQDLPFVKLVEEMQIERSLHRHPVFDVMFNFINTPVPSLDVSGLTFEALSLEETESRFLMTLYVHEHQGELAVRLVYRQSLFAPERMQLFMAQFHRLLEGVVRTPEQSIYAYSLADSPAASDTDAQKVLDTAPPAVTRPDLTKPLPEPIYPSVFADMQDWAQRQPIRPALRHGDHEWTYQQVVEHTHRIAAHLRQQGLQKGEAVALCGSRSVGFVVSMLGILRTGGVLVTVDATLPLSRQQVILEQSHAKSLIIVGSLPQGSLTDAPLPVVQITPEGEIVSSHSSRDSAHESLDFPYPEPSDPAYIFFTSGSTGTPKGIVGMHKGIAHFVHWQRNTFDVGPGDHVAQLIRPSFDAILRDIFLPLTSGATLCLPSTETDLAPKQLLSWLEQEQISLLHTVPTIAQTWLTQNPESFRLSSLRWTFLSGEPLTETLVRQWRQAFPEAGQMVNLYGATETTMVKCFYVVPDNLTAGVQPAGQPLPHTQALVLNIAHQLCSPGEIGEIVIRTPFRTLGYLNAPSTQEKRFVPNPFRSDAEDVLFYSGDRGRYRPDGTLEILGRLDEQIKIRGVRVQPGEIETVLNQHESVGESVVVAKETASGETLLVGYFTARLDDDIDLSELRVYLRQNLPEFLVPTSFLQLEALPLTPTGKVDRKALPEPDLEPADKATVVAPRTPTEEKVVMLFAEVLQRDSVSIHDNFFEIGGHSLLAILVCSRLRETSGVEVPIRTLFEAPSPAELSTAIDQMTANDTEPAPILPAITRVSRERRRASVSSNDEINLSETLKETIQTQNFSQKS